MKKNVITIGGTEYPCRLTLGVIKAFKEQTGKELADIGTDMVALGTLIHIAATKSGQKEKKPFPWQTADELLDDIDLADMPTLVEELFGEQSTIDSDAKKRKSRNRPAYRDSYRCYWTFAS
ncbi:MAG: hypothetical protein LUD46_23290 [Parabacteroides sp.]|nr:hypothetical protein [Parabacteroides sp.]